MTAAYKQPWLGNKWTDVFFILLPPFFSLLFIFLFPSLFQNQDGMSDAWWVALILLVDVAHVYSTLYRTYFDKQSYRIHKNKLFIIPFLSFVLGVLLYNFNAMIFWRALAYVAVFHFIRQQYGFMRLYSRREISSKLFRLIDTITIYSATIYPILYWHFSSNRKFNWFVEGDFFKFHQSAIVLTVLLFLYIAILFTYLIKEISFSIKSKSVNLPRNAVIMGTATSWYFGIVHFNGDMAFTLLNVVSHGIPYMALIWVYEKKSITKASFKPNPLMQLIFSRYGLVFFLAIIFLLAYVEEGLWDITLWKEHTSIFSIFHWGNVKLNHTMLSFVVPLLTIPQITHYIIDGFIWRIKKEETVME